ncbi:MAG: recombination mediator RecR [Pseudomonadota bacterium]|nr:recombination mediator RecR [Pseudomonadota bacterium]
MLDKTSGSKPGDEIERLISLMSRLPGLGKRSARRAVLHLVNKRESLMRPISEAVSDVYDKVQKCVECGNISTAARCGICTDESRELNKLCVVADVTDLWAMERSHTFLGRFHVLGGLLSALDGIDPNTLGIPKLVERVRSQPITEVILALSATVNGQTTAHYIADQLTNDSKVLITSLAHGVPVGGELDYLDEGTLDIAFKSRHEL